MKSFVEKYIQLKQAGFFMLTDTVNSPPTAEELENLRHCLGQRQRGTYGCLVMQSRRTDRELVFKFGRYFEDEYHFKLACIDTRGTTVSKSVLSQFNMSVTTAIVHTASLLTEPNGNRLLAFESLQENVSDPLEVMAHDALEYWSRFPHGNQSLAVFAFARCELCWRPLKDYRQSLMGVGPDCLKRRRSTQ